MKTSMIFRETLSLPGSSPSPCAGGSFLPDWALSFEWPPVPPRSPALPKLRRPSEVRAETTRARWVGLGGATRSASGIGRNPRSRTKLGPIKFEKSSWRNFWPKRSPEMGKIFHFQISNQCLHFYEVFRFNFNSIRENYDWQCKII